MDDSELWVPLVGSREEEDEELFFRPGETGSQASSETWLAGASDSLAPASQSADGTWPTRRLMFARTEVPDFTRIPRDRWRDVMCTIPEALRQRAVQGLALPLDASAELFELAVSDLPPTPSDRACAEVKAKPRLAPTPATDAFRRANRQVNFRLTEPEYLDLATAAQLIGTTPTQLAGMLVRNGVQRVIDEANRRDG